MMRQSNASSITKWLTPPDATTATRSLPFQVLTARATARPKSTQRFAVGWFGG